MLARILHEIETINGTVSLNELSRKLGVDRGALEGMIQFWVRKGRLVDDAATADECGITGSCGSACTGAANCAFVAKMPKTYSRSKEAENDLAA